MNFSAGCRERETRLYRLSLGPGDNIFGKVMTKTGTKFSMSYNTAGDLRPGSEPSNFGQDFVTWGRGRSDRIWFSS